MTVRRAAYSFLIRPVVGALLSTCGTAGCCNPVHAVDQVGRNQSGLREYRATWRSNNRHKLKGYRLLSKYKITSARFDEMMIAQAKCCAICSVEFDLTTNQNGRASCAIDHDHLTGIVRALLCRQCNAALGLFRDSPSILRAAADYLEKHGAK